MRTRSLLLLLLGMAVGMAASNAYAAGDPSAGAKRARTCMGCHGIPGYRNAYPSYRVPKLGGQHAEYLISALKDYRSGVREHPTMQTQAAVLSDQDIENIAAYFAQTQ